MRNTILVLLCLILMGLHPAFGREAGSSGPTLVIGLVVDQMRWDYLERFCSRFGEGGFRRLMDQGFRYDQTFIPYVPTYTAAGHATIYTGTPPSIHGIVANDWMERSQGERVYCVEDPNFRTLGEPGVSPRSGRMSPHRLRTTTVGDELKARDPKNRVYGISLKDRGAVLPAGHRGDGAIWLDDKSGTWVSSSYYGSELPNWVKSLNAKNFADQLYQDWELLHPESTYLSPLEDVNPYEGNLNGWAEKGFPHRLPQGKKDYSLLRYMPSGNDLVFEAAKACISDLQLGRSSGVDMLALSFSSTDYAGHLFGPESREVEDMYLRLDRSLEEFLAYLDTFLGRDRYLLFLTADHGAASNPRYLRDQGVPAGIFPEGEWKNELNRQIREKWGLDSLVQAWMNDQIYFHQEKIRESGINPDSLDALVETFLSRKQGILGWWPLRKPFPNFRIPGSIAEMIAQGYHPSRGGDYYLVNLPGWYGSSYQTGTTHGSWNPYDTHIPLIWYGHRIPQGRSWRKVSMVDIAPSLSAILGLSPPNGSTGEVLVEILSTRKGD